MRVAIRCPGCGRGGAPPCPVCFARVDRVGPLRPPPPLVTCTALLPYEGSARAVVRALKYRGQRGQAGWLGSSLAELLRGPDDAGPPPLDVVAWAPTTTARRRARGFDQAEVLARITAGHQGVPCRSLLARHPGPAQTGRSLAERAVGPAFAVRRPVGGLRVLLVDDVVTTGATLAAAGRALVAAGALEVHGAAAAHPP